MCVCGGVYVQICTFIHMYMCNKCVWVCIYMFITSIQFFWSAGITWTGKKFMNLFWVWIWSRLLTSQEQSIQFCFLSQDGLLHPALKRGVTLWSTADKMLAKSMPAENWNAGFEHDNSNTHKAGLSGNFAYLSAKIKKVNAKQCRGQALLLSSLRISYVNSKRK